MFYIHREEKGRPGRPSKCNSELETTLCDLYGDLTLSKKDIARKSGVCYFTLIHWQLERPFVRHLAAWRDHDRWIEKMRGLIARRATRGFDRRPYGNRRSKIWKQHRFVAWYLTYKVHFLREINEWDEMAACKRYRLSWEDWQEGKARVPLMERILAKRSRRKETGQCVIRSSETVLDARRMNEA
jgi:hypothetical protein